MPGAVLNEPSRVHLSTDGSQKSHKFEMKSVADSRKTSVSQMQLPISRSTKIYVVSEGVLQEVGTLNDLDNKLWAQRTQNGALVPTIRQGSGELSPPLRASSVNLDGHALPDIPVHSGRSFQKDEHSTVKAQVGVQLPIEQSCFQKLSASSNKNQTLEGVSFPPPKNPNKRNPSANQFPKSAPRPRSLSTTNLDIPSKSQNHSNQISRPMSSKSTRSYLENSSRQWSPTPYKVFRPSTAPQSSTGNKSSKSSRIGRSHEPSNDGYLDGRFVAPSSLNQEHSIVITVKNLHINTPAVPAQGPWVQGTTSLNESLTQNSYPNANQEQDQNTVLSPVTQGQEQVHNAGESEKPKMEDEQTTQKTIEQNQPEPTGPVSQCGEPMPKLETSAPFSNQEEPNSSAPTTPRKASSPKASNANKDAPTASNYPFKRLLRKQRPYLDKEFSVEDEAVLLCLKEMEYQRQKSVDEGNYQEARMHADRISIVRTTEMEKMRDALLQKQEQELNEVMEVFDQESAKFYNVWSAQIQAFEESFNSQKQQQELEHFMAMAKLAEERSKTMPSRPRSTHEYLFQKKMERRLADQQQYSRASDARKAAEELAAQSLKMEVEAHRAVTQQLMAKEDGRQRQKMEALLQRLGRGRAELEKRFIDDTGQRRMRLRNVVMELDSLHKVEVAYLESFFDSQVQAGRALPLRDSVFNRRREQVYSMPL